MTVWLLAIDKKCCSYEELKYRKVIAQGWSAIGNLSLLWPLKDQNKFKEIITNCVSYVYKDWKDERDPGRIILNLFSMKKNDYVICCEGETIRGIARLSNDLEYEYHNPSLYEYAHAVYPVTEWKNIKDNDHGIKLSSMGPVGIERYRGEINIVDLYESL